MEKPNILGMPIIFTEELRPDTIAMVDWQRFLRDCPRDPQGRLIVSPAFANDRLVWVSIGPCEEQSDD